MKDKQQEDMAFPCESAGHTSSGPPAGDGYLSRELLESMFGSSADEQTCDAIGIWWIDSIRRQQDDPQRCRIHDSLRAMHKALMLRHYARQKQRAAEKAMEELWATVETERLGKIVLH